MAAKTKIKVPVHKSDARFILTGGAIVTLFFFTSLRDPFNAPKLWLNVLLGAFLLGHLIADLIAGRFTEGERALRILAGIVGSFVGIMFVAAVSADVKYVAFIGETQRNTGWIDYFFLAVFLFSAAKHVRVNHLNMVYWFAIGIGAVMTEYGLLQHFGHDFVKWNNPYNSIISTVGNPDFAGGVMAFFLTLTFVAVIAAPWKVWVRGLIAVQVIVSLLVINWSQARQGLLAFALGSGIFLVIWIWTKKKLLGQISAAGGLVVFALGLAGIFQTGPLASILYKPSVSIRGFYWRAGYQMVIHHPWFGVGPDRFGAWFRTYRESSYPLRFGYDITSTAAHNVIVQLFATCGVFVGFSYLALLGFVAYRGILGIRRNSGTTRLLIAGLFASWIGYQSQSIVSIDNIGIAIWGWILSGIIIGMSLNETPTLTIKNPKRDANINTFKPVLAASTVLALLFLVIPLFRVESNVYRLTTYAIPNQSQGQSLRDGYHRLITSDLSIPLLNPQYRLLMATNLAQAGYVDEAFAQIDSEIKADPRDYGAFGIKASFFEQLHQYNKAIPARLRMFELDPWGAQNLLTLGQDYLAIGDKASAKLYGQKIIAMAPKTTQAQQAKSVLGA